MTNFISSFSTEIENQPVRLALIDGEVMLLSEVQASDNLSMIAWSEFFKEGGEIINRKATGDDLWYFSTEALDDFEEMTNVSLEDI